MVATKFRLELKGYPLKVERSRNDRQLSVGPKILSWPLERGPSGDHRRLKDTLGMVLTMYRREITPMKRGAVQEEGRLKRLLSDPIARISLASLTPQILAQFRDRRITDGSRACSYGPVPPVELLDTPPVMLRDDPWPRSMDIPAPTLLETLSPEVM